MQYKLLFVLLVIITTPSLYSAATCNLSQFLSCFSTDPNICLACEPKFRLVNGLCYPMSSTSCRVNYCLFCKTGNTDVCVTCENYSKFLQILEVFK